MKYSKKSPIVLLATLLALILVYFASYLLIPKKDSPEVDYSLKISHNSNTYSVGESDALILKFKVPTDFELEEKVLMGLKAAPPIHNQTYPF